MTRFIFLSLVGFGFVFHGIAHAQTIYIKQSDFTVSTLNTTRMGLDGSPMRIVPAIIGNPAPPSADTRAIPPGLLVPRVTAAHPPEESTFPGGQPLAAAASSNP